MTARFAFAFGTLLTIAVALGDTGISPTASPVDPGHYGTIFKGPGKDNKTLPDLSGLIGGLVGVINKTKEDAPPKIDQPACNCTCPVCNVTTPPLPPTYPLPPNPTPSQCGATSVPGGQSSVDQSFSFDTTGRTSVTLTYNANSVPDRFRVLSAVTGQVLYDTQFVGDANTCTGGPPEANIPVGPGQGSMMITLPPGTTGVIVIVSSPCDGTAWDFRLDCMP